MATRADKANASQTELPASPVAFPIRAYIPAQSIIPTPESVTSRSPRSLFKVTFWFTIYLIIHQMVKIWVKSWKTDLNGQKKLRIEGPVSYPIQNLFLVPHPDSFCGYFS